MKTEFSNLIMPSRILYSTNISKNFENPNFETGKNTEDIRSRMDNEAHLKSLAVTPQLIENAIFIDELPNEKGNGKYDSYRYYVLGLRMGSVDYTAKLVVGVKDGEAYYDHALTEIEKNSLLESIDPINTGFANKEDAVSAVKDKRLLSLLQTNSSKVVDENGEPRVIDGLYLNIKERNPITRLDISINKANNYVNKISEIENETGMEWDNESIFYQEEKAYNLLESIVSQKDYIEILINSIRKGIIPSIVVAYRYGDINERGRSYNYRDQIFEQGISVVGRVSELNTNIDKYYELFYGEQPYNIVVGVYSGNRGADGEILLTPATKLGLVENLGNIIKSATDNTGSFSSENADIRFRLDTPEEQQVSMAAQADGTWMKAPNGKPTNLTERQWVQVCTKAFKEWFGDWEKAARIEKLRQSEPAEITGKEVTPSDDLKQYKKNALEYGKNLRSEYTNKDTGETISLTAGNSRGGIREILQHDYKDVEHLQSIAAIPHIIENSIFIDEQPNEDLERYPGVKSFSYYVCGLKIGGVDYTVKAVIANQNNGERYYDHKLTNIEKGELLSIVPTIQKAGIDSKTPYPAVKDKRLLSLLQTNSSKVVDENGEPRVVYHGTNESFLPFDRNKAGISRNTCERQGRIGRNIWQKFFPERIRDSQKADGRKNGRINNLENKKSYSHRRKSYKNDAYFGFEQNFQHQR